MASIQKVYERHGITAALNEYDTKVSRSKMWELAAIMSSLIFMITFALNCIAPFLMFIIAISFGLAVGYLIRVSALAEIRRLKIKW